MTTLDPIDSPEFSERDLRAGSDRGFGVLFAVLFAIIGSVLWIGSGSLEVWPFAVSGAFLAVALARPGLLSPLHKAWIKLGLLLSRVVNPIVMAVLFFAVVTPTGLAMRWLGKDPLRLRYDRQAGSYWIRRSPPGPEPESMKRQF